MSKVKQLDKLIILAARASVFVAAVLLLAKLYAWFMTGSIGILAALVDSLLDLFASLVNMLAVRYAMVPPDQEHRFGHGKAEALAGLGQSIFIASSSLFLLIYSVERMIHPELIEEVQVGTYVIFFSILLTSILVAYQRFVVRKTGSMAIKADSLHYASDLISNLGILLGLMLYEMGWLYSDPIIALLIGIYILKCAVQIAYDAIQLLLDRALPEEEQLTIKQIVATFPEVLEVHGLRTRQSGRTKFIQLHLVMDGHKSLQEAHKLSDRVDAAIRQAFEDVDILIHQDPHTEAVDKEALKQL